MPTVIDSLVVTLGLDLEKWKAGNKIAAEQMKKMEAQASHTAKEMQADGAKAAEFFTAVKTEFLSYIGVVLGSRGVEAFVRDQTKSLADLAKEARNIGIAAGTLAAFGNVVELNGGNADAATASFRNLTDQMEHLKVYGNSPLLPFLNTIGAGRGDDAMTTYMKFVEWAQQHAKDVPLINLVGKNLGLDQGSINEAMRGVAQVRADFARAGELGVPTPEMFERATKFQRVLIALGKAAEHDGDMMLNEMYPGLTSVTDGLTVMIDKSPATLAALAGIAGYLTVIAGLNFKSVLGFLVRLAPIVALLGLTGPAGSPDQAPQIAEDKKIHDQYLKDHPDYKDPWDRLHGWWQNNMPTWLGGGASSAPLADTTMAPEQQTFLKSLSGPESGGDYTVKNGGSHFSDFSRFPEGIGPGGTSTASGRYQFTSGTWQEVAGILGLHDFSPRSQDQAAWFLAQREYRTKTGRDLQADLVSGNHGGDIATALNGRWPSLPGGSQYHAPRTASSAPIAPPPPRLPAPTPPSAASSGAGATHVTVNGLVVHTQAKDAPGIARDIHRSLIAQANSGPV